MHIFVIMSTCPCSNRCVCPHFRPLMDPIKNIDVLGWVAVETTYSCPLTALIACVAIATLVVAREGGAQMGKRKRKGNFFYRMVIHSNDVDCHDQIHMSRGALFHLSTILRMKGTLT